MSQPANTDPSWEIIGDGEISQQAIDALAALLIDIAESESEKNRRAPAATGAAAEDWAGCAGER